ncbi:hypothetical protein PPEP_a4156 [Pseudoalteromonas peptidolytica F12-50-A1]|uniref:Uncharacterized protein n=1 Tax=Pseudoalteromonas peptidolytica F12-50-A1 TaxID=1315280 RepID=A0A8I0MRV7_9GAMM|nr:hypothetical protein [Pseudoalteromonas peptidolytica F12-50-A1]
MQLKLNTFSVITTVVIKLVPICVALEGHNNKLITQPNFCKYSLILLYKLTKEIILNIILKPE